MRPIHRLIAAWSGEGLINSSLPLSYAMRTCLQNGALDHADGLSDMKKFFLFPFPRRIRRLTEASSVVAEHKQRSVNSHSPCGFCPAQSQQASL